MRYLLLTVMGLVLCGAVLGFKEHARDRAPAVDPAPQSPGATGAIRGVGYVEPVGQVRRLAFRRAGVIAICRVEPGQQVKKNDVLMVLENSSDRAALETAAAQVAVAQAERAKALSGAQDHEIDAARADVELANERLRFAREDHARLSNLSSNQATTDFEVRAAHTKVVQAEAALHGCQARLDRLVDWVRPEDKDLADAKVRLAQAQLRCAQQSVDDAELRAPSDGTVLETIKREGESVSPTDADPALVFADLSRLQIRAEIDERYVSHLKVGQPCTITGRGLADRAPGSPAPGSPAPGSSASGTVSSVRAIMGKKTVFTRSATERKDLDVLCVIVAIDPPFTAPVGLEVDVTFDVAQ